RRRSAVAPSSVRVEGGVELEAGRTGEDLDGSGARVAAEQEVVASGELERLDHARLTLVAHLTEHGDLGPGRDVQPGLDDAVVPERDAEAGVRPEEAALADRDDLLAAAGQGAHDRGAAADVGAVAHDDARGDAALDHRGAEGARVEVHEALVH